MSSTFDHFNVKRHYLKWIIIINWNFQGKCEIWGKSHSQGQQQPTYQKAKKGIYLLNKAPINFHFAHWQQILLTFFKLYQAAFEISYFL